jgi:Zn-dependent protease
VPVNFRNLRPQRLGMILVAMAGPLTNIALAWIFSRLYIWPAASGISNICAWAVMLNLTLAVFNMIPLPPLDGSRVVTGFLPERLAYEYNRLESFGFIILIVVMQLGLLRFLYPVIEKVGYWIGVQL